MRHHCNLLLFNRLWLVTGFYMYPEHSPFCGERCRTDGGMIGRETVQSEQFLPTRAKHAPTPRLTSAAGEGVMAIHMTVPAIQRRGKKARRAMPRGRIG